MDAVRPSLFFHCSLPPGNRMAVCEQGNMNFNSRCPQPAIVMLASPHQGS